MGSGCAFMCVCVSVRVSVHDLVQQLVAYQQKMCHVDKNVDSFLIPLGYDEDSESK